MCADEAGRGFGYAASVSCGYGEVKLTELERLGLIGKAVSFYQYRVLFDHIAAEGAKAVGGDANGGVDWVLCCLRMRMRLSF